MNFDPEELTNLRELRQQIGGLCLRHRHSLGLFHLAGALSSTGGGPVEVEGFTSLLPEVSARKARVSIASTASCVRSLLLCRDFADAKSLDFRKLINHLTERLDKDALDTTGLAHLNPFTTGLLLPALKEMGLEGDHRLVLACVDALKECAAQPGVAIDPYPPNGYLTYWCLRALQSWGVKAEEEGRPCIEWSYQEFLRQLSLFSAGDDEESDPYQLGYNLLIQYRFARSRLRETVLDLALDTLFEAQLDRGVWEKKDPIFVYGGLGDAYCFSFEFLSSLIYEFRSDSKRLWKYEEHLLSALKWVERNIILIPRSDQRIPVWRSGNRIDTKKPESWATGEVFSFLEFLQEYILERIQILVQGSFRGMVWARPDPTAFDHMYQPSVFLPKEGGAHISLKTLVTGRLLEPLRIHGHGLTKFSLVRNPGAKQRVRSGILFGPPGTGKTSYVQAIAKYLGWPLVVLDPSDFAREGLQLIPSTTTKIFEQLLALEDTVIFFDEMEELMRTRGANEGSSFEQRYLTTTLLPKLQDLHDRASCLFFVATNYYESIDEAAKRAGRFDFQIQMLPPSYDEKIRMVNDLWHVGVVPKVRLPRRVLTELEQDESRVKVKWATRSEMITLISDLQATPGKARAILTTFKPRLMDDNNHVKLEEEALFNAFERS